MSEERSKDEDVGRLKEELKEWIDHRIEYNNGFTNLLRGDYSLFISLIALFLSVYGAWKLGFLAQYYVLSIYLLYIVSLITVLLGSVLTLKASSKREQEGVRELISTKSENLFDWSFKWARPQIYSIWILFLLSIPVLLIIGEKRWWLWAPAILFVLFLPVIAERGAQSFASLLDSIKEKPKIELNTTKKVSAIATIMLILILIVIGIYLGYRIIEELTFIVLRDISSLFGIILTIILILVVFASLSEYLSMKFIIADVSNQDYALSMLRTEIDRIEDAKTLENNKKELLGEYLPKADSFLIFFNYYYLMFTGYTFEVGEEEEEEESN